MTVTIKIPGLPALEQFVQGMAAHAQNQRPMLDEVRDEIEDIFSEKFLAAGPGWAAQKPLTIAKRAGLGTSGPLLYETGTLEESYRRGGTDHIETFGMDSVEVGSALKYASAHEDGFSNRGTVPAFASNPPIRMRGQRVAARPLLTTDTNNADNRIADRYANALFRLLGL